MYKFVFFIWLIQSIDLFENHMNELFDDHIHYLFLIPVEIYVIYHHKMKDHQLVLNEG